MLNVLPTMLHTTTLAYLDGGTGSLLLQSAVAGVLTAGYVMKTQWAYLKARFARKSPASAAPAATPKAK
ncbi:hypothetical protein EON79_19390 [bacterium]|nr:MAG: hypothetical protein EON79_19390 [bacterium]